MTGPSAILALCDAGKMPAEIAAALDVPLPGVYAILRAKRPNRKRAPRPCTSQVPALVRGLNAEGVAVGRIATLCQVSRAYVYRLRK